MPHPTKHFSRLGLKLAGAAVILLSPAAFAVDGGGCVDSPESATAVLGLLGAGAASLPWLRRKLTARRRGAANRSPVEE